MSADLELAGNFLSSLMDSEDFTKTSRDKPSSSHSGNARVRALNLFKNEIRAYIENNPSRDSVLKQLSDNHWAVLKGWIGAADRQTLLIVGDKGNDRWTTNLLMEIIPRKPRTNTLFYTAHLCRANRERKKRAGRAKVLIRDLVGQLVEVYRERFDGVETHSQLESSTQGASATSYDAGNLWRVFTRCVKQAGVRELIVVLDRIEFFYVDCDRPVFDAFLKSLEGTCEKLRKDGIIMRVLFISANVKVGDCLRQMKTLKTIRLPEPPIDKAIP